MTTIENLTEASAAIVAETEQVNAAAKTKTKEKPRKCGDSNKPVERIGDGLIRNAKGDPVALDETYWMDQLAATKDVIYDPQCDSFYLFMDGLWEKVARPVITEWIARQVTANCPDCPPKLKTRRAYNEIALRLTGHPTTVRSDAFSKVTVGVILVQNGRLEISKTGVISFKFGDRGRKCDMKHTRLAVEYKPCAKASRLLKWFQRVFSGRQDDVDALGNMMGAVLWGSNRWKKLVYISGAADLGKSQIPLVVEGLVGRQVCIDIETKRIGERFEFHRFLGKIFLRAADVDADFMSRAYADAFKQLSGFDSLRVEKKNSQEEFELRGDKMICVGSNFRPRVRAGVDRSAWEARLVYLVADGKPYTAKEQDRDFIENLFSDPKEASGILNFALDGLRRLLTNGWVRSETQMARVEAVMEQGSHVETWVEQEIQRTPKGLEDPDRPGLTISEAWTSYLDWCEDQKIDPWERQRWTEIATAVVEDAFHKPTSNSIKRGTYQRGWSGLSLRPIFKPVARVA
jgi:phage/plasmid-associated DNA primase